MISKWDEPAFSEIKMDAEIGAYQDDFDPARQARPGVIAPRALSDAELDAEAE